MLLHVSALYLYYYVLKHKLCSRSSVHVVLRGNWTQTSIGVALSKIICYFVNSVILLINKWYKFYISNFKAGDYPDQSGHRLSPYIQVHNIRTLSNNCLTTSIMYNGVRIAGKQRICDEYKRY